MSPPAPPRSMADITNQPQPDLPPSQEKPLDPQCSLPEMKPILGEDP